jgi:glycosyltransferase involved in cell wall biosynthesis
MRLLAVLSSVMGGGAERQMLVLLRHLDRSRFDASLCLLAAEGPFLSEVPSSVPIIDLAKKSPWDVPALVLRLARLMRRSEPGVVLSRLDYTNVLTAFAARAGRVSAPLVMTEDSVQSLELPGMSHAGIRKALLGSAYRRAARVVAVAPGIASDLSQHLGVADSALEVIPNMVEIERLKRDASAEPRAELTHGTPLIVAAGRLTPAKGQADLLAAIGILATRKPCRLAVLGEGPDLPRLQRLADDLGVAQRVRFLGFVENPFAIMSRADLFVSPSYRESFGNVILEAMALGVPVLSTKVPTGPEWLIRDGETGIFARPRDPDDLAAKIELLLGNDDLRRSVGARGAEEARKFDASVVVPRYERLLEEVAGR